jgi:hypothetical protein
MSTAGDTVKLPSTLEDVRIADMPGAAYYIADFVTEDEEGSLLNKVGKCRTDP